MYVGQVPSSGRPITVPQFALTTSGIVSPTSILTVPQSNFLYALTSDRAGQLYVPANDGALPSVLVYPAGASGTDAPIRTITGGNGSFDTATLLSVDGAGQLYVYDGNTLDATGQHYIWDTGSIYVFAAGANGAATPLRVISGPLTRLTFSANNSVCAMTVDPSGNLYVAVESVPVQGSDYASILIFPPTANGNTAPARTITAINKSISNFSGLLYLRSVTALATDTSGNLYAATGTDVAPYYNNIVEFAPNANAAALPMKMIAGNDTGLEGVTGLAVDNAGNIFVSQVNGYGQLSVEGFGAAGSGDLIPAIQFTSSSLLSVAFGQMALR